MSSTPESGKRPASVAIIGAGFAGVAMAHYLQRAGIHDFDILERAESPGGTWRDNRYPGAACDVPSLLYSFSFYDKSDWPDFFGRQADIHSYIEECCQALGISRHIRYNTAVIEAAYDEDQSLWTLTTAAGEEMVYEHVVFAVGQLSEPQIPAVPGLEGFTGRYLHSARWEDDLELTGKKVAIIGNGATVIQLAPAIADSVDTLSVFQRSANWIIPKPIRPNTVAYDLLERTKAGRKVLRSWLYLQRERRIAVMTNDKANEELTAASRGYFEQTVQDVELRSRMIPDYKLGCKRILISNHYLQAFSQDNISLVTDGVQRIEGDDILTADGTRHQADVIIFSTGFKATDFLGSIKVTGRSGKSLSEKWSDGAGAYLGISVPDFPNMSIMYGPNTNLGFNSVVYMLESQASHIVRLLKLKRMRQCDEVEVSAAAYSRFETWTQEKLDKTAWAAGCSAWYKTASGKITNNWPLHTFTYRLLTRYAPLTGYRFTSARRTLRRREPVA